MKRKNESDRSFKKTAIVVGIVIIAAVLLCIGGIVLQPDCSELPEVPEYPNGIIIRTNESPGSYPKIAGSTYETTASYEEVLTFYSSQMRCHDAVNNRTICEANPVHYMDYSVYLDKNSESPYRYILEVRWNPRCGDVSQPYDDLFG